MKTVGTCTQERNTTSTFDVINVISLLRPRCTDNDVTVVGIVRVVGIAEGGVLH